MKRILIVLALLLCPALAEAQSRTTDAERAAYRARRDSLEAAVVQSFHDRLARELKLDGQQKAQVAQVLAASGERRRNLMRETNALRSKLHRAARAADTPDGEFNRLLAEFTELRAREHQLWTRDQEELSRILNPRQRVQFLVSWTLFQENIREIVSDRMRSDDKRNEDKHTTGDPERHGSPRP